MRPTIRESCLHALKKGAREVQAHDPTLTDAQAFERFSRTREGKALLAGYTVSTTAGLEPHEGATSPAPVQKQGPGARADEEWAAIEAEALEEFPRMDTATAVTRYITETERGRADYARYKALLPSFQAPAAVRSPRSTARELR